MAKLWNLNAILLMLSSLILLALLCLHHGAVVAEATATLGLSHQRQTPMSASKTRNGFNFLNGQWSAPKYDSLDAEESLIAMQQQTGADWVAITYCHFLASINSTGPIYARADVTPTDDQIRTFIQNVTHPRGVKAFFRPCVDPDWRYVPKGWPGWRGEFGMFFTNEQQWDDWFDTYEEFIVKQARLALELQPYGVELFAIGMEYTAASQHSSHWRRIASAVKAVFDEDKNKAGGGSNDNAGSRSSKKMNLTYCANFGAEVGIDWWDAVDEVSVDAYYMLAWDVARPNYNQILDSWQPIVAELQNISTFFGGGEGGYKPVNFAEIGYCSATGSNTFPAHCGGDPLFAPNNPLQLNFTLQNLMYGAFFEAVYSQPWFRGVFWWDWLTDPRDGGPNSTGFSVKDKPVAGIIKSHFGGGD